MNSLLQLLLPTDWLIDGLNAAIAALLACAMALVLSRRGNWSLPLRHALLVAGLAASLLLPLAMPRLHLPTVWAIRVAEAVDSSPPPVITPPNESFPENVTEIPAATFVPLANARPARPLSPEPPAIEAASVAPDTASPTIKSVRSSFTAVQWARIVGTFVCSLWFAGILIGVARSLVGLLQLRRWMQTVTSA